MNCSFLFESFKLSENSLHDSEFIKYTELLNYEIYITAKQRKATQNGSVLSQRKMDPITMRGEPISAVTKGDSSQFLIFWPQIKRMAMLEGITSAFNMNR